MKKIISVLAIALCFCLFLTACSTSFAYTFTIENGDRIKVKLDTTNGHQLEQENGQFTVVEEGKDPMYGALKDQAVKNGRMAMLDTQAQAANLTGGYGSSYAQSVGHQAYNSYLQQLGDRIPELYRLAYEMYMDGSNGEKEPFGWRHW